MRHLPCGVGHDLYRLQEVGDPLLVLLVSTSSKLKYPQAVQMKRLFPNIGNVAAKSGKSGCIVPFHRHCLASSKK